MLVETAYPCTLPLILTNFSTLLPPPDHFPLPEKPYNSWIYLLDLCMRGRSFYFILLRSWCILYPVWPGKHSVGQACCELGVVLLPQPSRLWIYRHGPLHLAWGCWLKSVGKSRTRWCGHIQITSVSTERGSHRTSVYILAYRTEHRGPGGFRVWLLACILTWFCKCKMDKDGMGQEEGIFRFEKSRASTKAWRRKLCRGDRGFLDGWVHACCLWFSELECIPPLEINCYKGNEGLWRGRV